QVKPICVKHEWSVAHLEEFYPSNKGLLGVNINRTKICVRLREPRDADALYPFELALDIVLHELTHMVHGAHSADFYRLLDALREECEALMTAGISGRNMPWQGEGRALGGGSAARDVRAAAAAAAARRAQAGAIMQGSG
ncbi:WLM domain-containing protein, partial [Tribonema minus]